MNDRSVRRFTGAFGIASIALIVLAQPLYLVGGTPPRLQDTIRLSEYVTRNNAIILSRSLADVLIIACFLVFLVGLRHLIRQARPDDEWASLLVFAAGLVFAMLTLLGDVLEGALALDTIGGKPDPTVVRALWEASIPAFGAIGLLIMALFLASAGYAILATKALPRWIGWLACAGAIGNLVAAPAIYAGANAAGFYTADGFISLLSELPFLVWAVSVSMVMIIGKRKIGAPAQRERGFREAG
jgi:hypothetical protein